MRIAISGMRGSLGRILYERLSDEGHSVVGLTRHATPRWAEWRHEDYTHQASSIQSIKDVDVLIHCAGGGLAGDKQAIFAANTHTTKHLVDTVNQLRQPLLFIFVSSIAAGGPADLLGRPRTPSDQPNPISHYGHSKLAAETILEQLSSQHRAFTFRLPTCHGGYEYRWDQLLKCAQHGLMVLPPPMHLSHIHVRDVAEATIHLLRDPPIASKTWNLCSPESFRWTDLPTMVERLLRRPIRSVSMPRQQLSMPMLKLLTTMESFGFPASRYTDKLRDAQYSDWRADASECYNALKFTPQRTLADGLKEMIA
ncbi:MAG: NAD(P)-dependent oxidoreductase [Myxococcota bacterium]|nr:NAD(P)-dependent oxidoreductase [Myxococcota bacterium]